MDDEIATRQVQASGKKPVVICAHCSAEEVYTGVWTKERGHVTECPNCDVSGLD